MDVTSPMYQSALEALRYQQRPQLYQSLVSTYQDALEGDLLAVQRASSVIKHATNMPTTVVRYQATVPFAFTQFTSFDVNNVLRNPVLQGLEGKKVSLTVFAKFLDEQRASVKSDGSVTGIFTQFPAQIYLSEALFQGAFTAEELAAITLHEMGHLYGYFDTLGQTLLASIAIGQLEELLQGIENLETRSHYIESTVKVLSLKHLDPDEIARKEDAGNLRYVLIRDVIAKLVTETGSDKVFRPEAEFLADSYAVHMGAASHLVSALVKIAKAMGDKSFLDKQSFIATEAVKAALSILVVGVAGTLFSPIAFAIGTTLGAAVMATRAQDITERNTVAERLDAIHQELVAILKDRSLTKDAQTSLLKDVEFISTLREEVKDRFTIVGAILYTLSPLARRTYKQIKLQQELSRLIHNDLFIKAAQLKQLASPSTSRNHHGA